MKRRQGVERRKRREVRQGERRSSHILRAIEVPNVKVSVRARSYQPDLYGRLVTFLCLRLAEGERSQLGQGARASAVQLLRRPCLRAAAKNADHAV
eukprot:746143-Hanusia_phi.AAC.6